MVTVSRSYQVDRPVDVVVGYLEDFGHAEQWDPGTTSCTRIDSGPIEVGARWRNVSTFLGRSTELEYRLERLELGRLTFIGTNKTAQSTDDMTVVANGAGSTITYRATIVFNGLAKLADPLLRLVFERLATGVEKQMTTVVNGL